MRRPEVVHIAPSNGAWRVYRHEYDAALRFDELGEALDAASKLVPEGTAVRIVIHEAAAPAAIANGAGYSAAA